MKTYRLYRVLARTQYRDVVAEDEHSARQNGAMYSPREEWTTTDDGHIIDTLVTTPENVVQGHKLFVDQEVQRIIEATQKEAKV